MNRLKALYRSWAVPCAGRDVYYTRHRAEWLGKIREAGCGVAPNDSMSTPVSANGTIVSYVIKAVPVRRFCGSTRSFTIADDGRLYSTQEERAATVSDQPLQ
jgi:hypothetical protein